MIEERLTIPLYENPTRQAAWRVVRFLSPLCFAAVLAAVLYRGFFIRDNITRFAPEGTTTAVRFLKTSKATERVQEYFGDTILLKNSPYTLNDILSMTNREVAVFFNGTEIIGIAIDREFPIETKDGKLFYKENRGFPRFNLSLLFPTFDGEIISFNQNLKQAAPFSLSASGLTISSRTDINQAPPAINISPATRSFTLLSLSNNEIANFLGLDVPLVYAGVQSFIREAEEKGLTVYFGEDEDGFVYNFSIEGGDLTTEEVEALVAELFYSPEITAVSSGKDAFSYDEFRVEAPVTLETKREGDFTIVSAKDSEGNIVRATETSHYLIVTNRDVSLTSRPPESTGCLRGAREFLRPADLEQLLPRSILLQSNTLATQFFGIKEIAMSKNKTKVCW